MEYVDFNPHLPFMLGVLLGVSLTLIAIGISNVVRYIRMEKYIAKEMMNLPDTSVDAEPDATSDVDRDSTRQLQPAPTLAEFLDNLLHFQKTEDTDFPFVDVAIKAISESNSIVSLSVNPDEITDSDNLLDAVKAILKLPICDFNLVPDDQNVIAVQLVDERISDEITGFFIRFRNDYDDSFIFVLTSAYGLARFSCNLTPEGEIREPSKIANKLEILQKDYSAYGAIFDNNQIVVHMKGDGRALGDIVSVQLDVDVKNHLDVQTTFAHTATNPNSPYEVFVFNKHSSEESFIYDYVIKWKIGGFVRITSSFGDLDEIDQYLTDRIAECALDGGRMGASLH